MSGSLQFRPTQNIGPDFGAAIDNAQQLMQFQAFQKQTEQQNKLRDLLGQPGAITPETGQLKPDIIAKAMGIDPAYAMKLQQNAQSMQHNALATQHLQGQIQKQGLDRQGELQELIEPARVASMEAYTNAQGSEAAKIAAGQKALDETLNPIRNGGGLSEQEKSLLNPTFDPVRIGGLSTTWQKRLEEKRKTDNDANKSAFMGADSAGNPVLVRPDAPDPKQRFVYAQTNQPLTPEQAKTVTKVGGGTPAAAAEHDADVIANAQIAREEQNGPVIEERKAQIRQQARMAPKIEEANKKAAGRPNVAAERDAMTRADAQIADSEQKNGPISEEQKAAIRQAARSDPKVQETIRKNEANAISDDAAELTAQETLRGDWHGTVGLARNSASMRKIADARGRIAKEQGISGADLAANTAEFNGIMAAERVLGTRGAGIDLGIVEAQKFAPMVLDLSDKIDRTRFPTFNALQLAVEQGTGGENVVRFIDAMNAYKMAYTQILTRGGMPTDDARRRSDEIIDKAWSNGQISAAVDQLSKEMNAARSAVPAVRDSLYFSLTGKHRTSPVETVPSPQRSGGETGGGHQHPPPNPANIRWLKKNPDKAADWDKSYPDYPSSQYLGGATTPPPAQAPAQSTSPTPSPAPQAGPRATQSTAPTTEGAAPSQKFVEGKIYVDGNGNRAVYKNGKFEPVQ